MSDSVSVGRTGRRAVRIISAVLAVGVCLLAPGLSQAQSVEDLNRQADAAGAKGLPVAPLRNKIREGIAKNQAPKSIELVLSQMVVNLEAADRIVREVEPGASGAARESAVTLLADALFGVGGLTPEEIRDLQRQAAAPLSSQALAGAAKGLSFVKEARLPVTEGTAVMAEAVRQKFRSTEMLDLGREIKRREADYRAGRASLRALRDAIARGTRPETLLRDSRAERPAATRPDATTDRPERTPPVDRPPRTDRPPDRPAAPGGERTR